MVAPAPGRYLRSKLLRPRLADSSIRRPRLADRLSNSGSPVWLISAPAGYGKTTIVLEAIESTDATVGWVSLDPADNDPARFWPHVAASVVDNDEALAAIVDDLDPGHIDSVVDDILATIEAMGKPVIIVLDDVHEIDDPGILESLSRIATYPPANLTLVLVTRVDPALPIGRLRSHGQLAELRVGDLAFTTEEAAGMFTADLDPSTVAEIVAATEGWATALGMLAVSTESGHSATDLLSVAVDGQSDLGDFLAGEVLDRLPDALQHFLIETSLLDVLEPDLCDTILGEPGSLSKLRELARGRVFTQLVEPATNTFQYHALFRDFLRARSQELPLARLQAIHQAAARWFVDHEEPTAAIRHAIAADNRELALATIKRYYLPYSQAGLLATVQQWLTSFGVEEWALDRELRLMAAWAALNTCQYDELDRLLQPPQGQTYNPAELVEVHSIASHRARHVGDLATAVSEGDLAAEHLDGNMDGYASVAQAARGAAHVLAGEDAEQILAAAISIGRSYDMDSSIVMGYSYLALAASTDTERLDEAKSLADQALSHVTSPVLERFHRPAAALLVKSRAALGKGLIADAEELANRAQTIAEASLEPLLSALIHSQQARIAHKRGDQDQARASLRQAEQDAGDKAGDWINEQIRQTRNAIRFAAVNSDVELMGAVELTPKEAEVLALLPHKILRRELAAQLFMSENTLKTHLSSIRHKLALERKDDIVQRARELGLLPNDPAEG